MTSHPAALQVEMLLRDCEVQALKRGGPGGQHRNKTETAVRIVHLPSGQTGEASERRSREANRKQAIQRLRLNLATNVRSANHGGLDQVSFADTSSLWDGRLCADKIHISENHEDFPALLAELIDCITFANLDFVAASSQVRISSSQIVRVLKMHPPAFRLINDARRVAGLRELR